jgi:preprotein translocase subunit SecA
MMEDAVKVREVGGLHVIGSERHEARRIDNQLRGRAARQGDPGSSQFFLSLGDELMRRFGGQGVSDLMQRLKIDDSVPIAAGIVNRTIEGSQTRVEGANFDIRKHLLEYDDVLNSQRNAIYTQRDRVFIKEDLTDDFDEMLVAEVERRVELNSAEADRWKLFAWLDEIQPPIVLNDGAGGEEIYPTYTQTVLLREVEGETDKKAALVELARDALKAERTHQLEAVETAINRADERLESQIKERRRAAEDALEGLENEAEETNKPIDARTAYRLVSEVLGLNIQPTTQEIREFDGREFKRRIEEWAENAVNARTRAALVATIERRLGAQLNLNNKTVSAEDWNTQRQQLIEAAEKTFAAKTERVLADVEREVKSNLAENATPTHLKRALWAMMFGRAVAFDQKTHKRTEFSFQRLNYAYLAGDMVSDWDVKDLKEEVLAHLREATQALTRLFGQTEHRARMLANATFTETPEELGRKANTNVYRQLMLQTIGGLWVEYLTSMEALRTSIGLEAYAQRDPLVAYKTKATEMWHDLLANIRAGVVGRALQMRPRLEVQPQQPTPQAPARPAAPQTNGAPAKPETEGEAEPAGSGGGGKRKRKRR